MKALKPATEGESETITSGLAARTAPTSSVINASIFSCRQATNRELVAGHDDWVAAWFTANRANNEIVVIAHWRDPDSYERLRSSAPFQSTMARFAESFVAPPEISINEILVEM